MARAVIRAAKRRKQWAGIPGILRPMTANSTSVGGSLDFAGGGNTLLRMMGEYSIGPDVDTAPVANDACEVTVAFAVLSSDAIAAGQSAVPDPASEPEYPWLYWRGHALHFNTTSVDPNSPQAVVRHSFDVRTMRKIRAGEGIVVILQYVDDSGNPPISVNMAQTRFLVALP